MTVSNIMTGQGGLEAKQEEYELVITSEDIVSTDVRFTMQDLALGDNYTPLDTYFMNQAGEVFRRKLRKGEYKISIRTMPRLACQIFESEIENLSKEEKENFPICRYKSDSNIIRGIFPSIDAFKEHNNSKTWEHIDYIYNENKQFVFYGYNIFSTILFVQECLKRFGKEGDKFVLIYREKGKKDNSNPEG
ncbi:MAG: ATP-binding protein [Ruminococcaceae bacterium]|nr:ATP-binding protein [Oscillospiraceae bacterium]